MLVAALCIALSCASAQRTEVIAFDIVDEGMVRFRVRTPSRFVFERGSLGFRVRLGADEYENTLSVSVTPSELPIDVLPDPRTTLQGVIAGIPARWRVYEVDHSRTLYMGNLVTGVECRGGIMLVGVSVAGNDTRAIETLLGIAAAMSIEAAKELADLDAVMKKCHVPSDKP